MRGRKRDHGVIILIRRLKEEIDNPRMRGRKLAGEVSHDSK